MQKPDDTPPKRWDNDAVTVLREIGELIRPMTDHGSSMDSGGGDNFADMYITVGGENFSLVMKKCTVTPNDPA